MVKILLCYTIFGAKVQRFSELRNFLLYLNTKNVIFVKYIYQNMSKCYLFLKNTTDLSFHRLNQLYSESNILVNE